MNVSIVLLVLSCASLAYAQGTKGAVIQGYTFTVDSTPYRGLSNDCAQIRANVAANNYAAANTIYRSGKNMVTATGAKSLKSVATAMRSGESYYATHSAFYGGANYIERTLLPGGSLSAAAGLDRIVAACQWIMLSFIGHELDVAKSVIAANSAKAIEEIDDAFAIFIGNPSGASLNSHISQVERWIPCAGPINGRVVDAFKAMKAAAVAKNAARFNTQLAAYNKPIIAVYLRSIVYAGTKNNANLQKGAFGYLKVIHPFLLGRGPAAQLSTILGGAALANPATVKSLVQTLATQQGLSVKDAGIC